MVSLAATAAPVVGVMVILALYTLRRMPDAVGRQQLWSLLPSAPPSVCTCGGPGRC
jgi:hypothetical protein